MCIEMSTPTAVPFRLANPQEWWTSFYLLLGLILFIYVVGASQLIESIIDYQLNCIANVSFSCCLAK